jgi:DNA sulfur modification protein DndE
MNFTKIRISAHSTTKLRSLHQRTRLTPNLLCRAAFMLSLEEGSASAAILPPEDGAEFNQYTLTGELHSTFASLLRFVEHGFAEDNERLVQLFRAHIERGVGILSARAKSPEDVLSLVV